MEEKQAPQKKSASVMIKALLVMLLWGSLYPMVKLGYQKFGVRTANTSDLLLFAGVRFFLCGGIVSLFCAAKKRQSIERTKRGWSAVLLVALFSVALHYSFTYIGLSKADSSKTALLKQLGTLFFICFSFLFFKEEKFSARKGIGAIFGVAGIICINTDAVRFSLGVGEILIVSSSFCTVLSNVFLKKLSPKADPVFTVGFSQLFGGAALLIIGLLTGGRLHMPNAVGWLVFLYIAFANIAGHLLWYSVVGKAELSYLFLIKLSEPLFAMLAGAALLGENILRWQYLLAFLCIAVAVVVSNLSPKRKK